MVVIHKRYPDLMLDLETMATSHNAAIVQIGACFFDRATGAIGSSFCGNVELDSALDIGLETDGRTVLWWLGQDKAAQESLLKDRKDIKQVLRDFAAFSKKAKAVWSHATFDFVILMNAFARAGIDVPFSYRAARDLRTLVDLAKVSYHKRPREGTHHNALDDCVFQVGYAVEAMNKLAGV